jgi:hypothetical protein
VHMSSQLTSGHRPHLYRLLRASLMITTWGLPATATVQGDIAPVGSERWYAAVDAVGLPVIYADQKKLGEEVLTRFMGLASSDLPERRAAQGNPWYVAPS